MKYKIINAIDDKTQFLLDKVLNIIFDTNVQVISVEKMVFGVENHVFHLTTDELGKSKDYILKISCQERFKATKISYFQRKYIEQDLLRVGVPVPRIISYHEIEDSYYVLLLDYIHGNPCLPNVSQIQIIAEYLYHVQTIPINETFIEYMGFNSFHGLRNKDVEPMVLVHGDFHLGNLLWNNGTLNGIVDWDTIHIGYPEEDVAHCYIDILLLINNDLATYFLRVCESSLKLNKDRLRFFLSEDAKYTLKNYHKWTNGFFGKFLIIDEDTVKDRLLSINNNV